MVSVRCDILVVVVGIVVLLFRPVFAVAVSVVAAEAASGDPFISSG